LLGELKLTQPGLLLADSDKEKFPTDRVRFPQDSVSSAPQVQTLKGYKSAKI
jgi:hypothetical protein